MTATAATPAVPTATVDRPGAAQAGGADFDEEAAYFALGYGMLDDLTLPEAQRQWLARLAGEASPAPSATTRPTGPPTTADRAVA